MESEKLLPCPFCGAEDKYLVQAFTRATETFAFWSVECSFCGVEVADDESQEKANAAWNTRAPADLRSALEAETIKKLRDAAALVARAIGVTQMPDGTASALAFSGNDPGPQLEDILSARAAIASLEGHVS